jgi:hypothetical protein
MKFVKLGLISVLVLSVILFLLSLIIPSSVRVSRAINIRAPKNKVYEKIASTKDWPAWNTMANDKLTIAITESRPAIVRSEWGYKGKKIASGIKLETYSDITVVQWYFDFYNGWYPWRKFGSLIYDKQFGPGMEQSLNNLKSLIEKSP